MKNLRHTAIPCVILGCVVACTDGDMGEDSLEDAVWQYGAYALSEPAKAYDLLSSACKERLSQQEFEEMSAVLKTVYPDGLEVTEIGSVTITDDTAQVSYTMSDPSLSQNNEKWVVEDDKWKKADC